LDEDKIFSSPSVSDISSLDFHSTPPLDKLKIIINPPKAITPKECKDNKYCIFFLFLYIIC
jgi:hypothetical protein